MKGEIEMDSKYDHVTLREHELAVFRTKVCERHRQGNCLVADRCSNSHCQTWQRRNPKEFTYSSKLCPDIEFVKKGSKMTLVRRCSRGRACMFAHSKEEELYHPSMYKTKFCNSHPNCTRYYCPFAHSSKELRKEASAVADAYIASAAQSRGCNSMAAANRRNSFGSTRLGSNNSLRSSVSSSGAGTTTTTSTASSLMSRSNDGYNKDRHKPAAGSTQGRLPHPSCGPGSPVSSSTCASNPTTPAVPQTLTSKFKINGPRHSGGYPQGFDDSPRSFVSNMEQSKSHSSEEMFEEIAQTLQALVEGREFRDKNAIDANATTFTTSHGSDHGITRRGNENVKRETAQDRDDPAQLNTLLALAARYCNKESSPSSNDIPSLPVQRYSDSEWAGEEPPHRQEEDGKTPTTEWPSLFLKNKSDAAFPTTRATPATTSFSQSIAQEAYDQLHCKRGADDLALNSHGPLSMQKGQHEVSSWLNTAGASAGVEKRHSSSVEQSTLPDGLSVPPGQCRLPLYPLRAEPLPYGRSPWVPPASGDYHNNADEQRQKNVATDKVQCVALDDLHFQASSPTFSYPSFPPNQVKYQEHLVQGDRGVPSTAGRSYSCGSINEQNNEQALEERPLIALLAAQIAQEQRLEQRLEQQEQQQFPRPQREQHQGQFGLEQHHERSRGAYATSGLPYLQHALSPSSEYGVLPQLLSLAASAAQNSSNPRNPLVQSEITAGAKFATPEMGSFDKQLSDTDVAALRFLFSQSHGGAPGAYHNFDFVLPSPSASRASAQPSAESSVNFRQLDSELVNLCSNGGDHLSSLGEQAINAGKQEVPTSSALTATANRVHNDDSNGCRIVHGLRSHASEWGSALPAVAAAVASGGAISPEGAYFLLSTLGLPSRDDGSMRKSHFDDGSTTTGSAATSCDSVPPGALGPQRRNQQQQQHNAPYCDAMHHSLSMPTLEGSGGHPPLVKPNNSVSMVQHSQ